ncbi:MULTISPECIES: hypothetical protein [Legionella]|uniref:Transmembrane protein n=1 Tax=Legionella steelei TaxID=947033 RepID=A0A0W0ZJM0_9GAMM|nr:MULTISPECIES: hypothetical protein [Legionella]KTD69612.1 transmembrane protein [Legionella steelei]MBN9227163.1 hypothetical protein [Legionella steelei]OJW07276.1 MAG: hypothetical protein BGO44_16765 [Legionella sp. 39-23]
MALPKKVAKFFETIGYLPASAFVGLSKLVLGGTDVDADGKPTGTTTRGLVGLLADGAKYLARSATDFLANHKKAIAIAAWASLAVAGAAALTLFLWPAALAAVATFSIGGLSIAAIAGASTLAQIGLAAGLAAAATSALVYTGAAIGNFASWVAKCCKDLRAKKGPSSVAPTGLQDDEEEDLDSSHEATATLGTGSRRPLARLSTSDDVEASATVTAKKQPTATVVRLGQPQQPQHFPPVLATATVATKKKDDAEELQQGRGLGLSGSQH